MPEAVREAIGLWGGGCNDSGVFTRYERVEIARLSDSCHAAVLIAKGGNGLFGYLLLLDVALLYVAQRREWPVLAVLALAGTAALLLPSGDCR